MMRGCPLLGRKRTCGGTTGLTHTEHATDCGLALLRNFKRQTARHEQSEGKRYCASNARRSYTRHREDKETKLLKQPCFRDRRTRRLARAAPSRRATDRRGTRSRADDYLRIVNAESSLAGVGWRTSSRGHTMLHIEGREYGENVNDAVKCKTGSPSNPHARCAEGCIFNPSVFIIRMMT
jgi:hypothetical protein